MGLMRDRESAGIGVARVTVWFLMDSNSMYPIGPGILADSGTRTAAGLQ